MKEYIMNKLLIQPKHLETKPGAAADNFHYVNIYDSYKDVSWGSLTHRLITEPVVSVTEFYEDVMTAAVRYCVAIDAGYGAETYFVEEYFPNYKKER